MKIVLLVCLFFFSIERYLSSPIEKKDFEVYNDAVAKLESTIKAMMPQIRDYFSNVNNLVLQKEAEKGNGVTVQSSENKEYKAEVHPNFNIKNDKKNLDKAPNDVHDFGKVKSKRNSNESTYDPDFGQSKAEAVFNTTVLSNGNVSDKSIGVKPAEHPILSSTIGEKSYKKEREVKSSEETVSDSTKKQDTLKTDAFDQLSDKRPLHLSSENKSGSDIDGIIKQNENYTTGSNSGKELTQKNYSAKHEKFEEKVNNSMDMQKRNAIKNNEINNLKVEFTDAKQSNHVMNKMPISEQGISKIYPKNLDQKIKTSTSNADLVNKYQTSIIASKRSISAEKNMGKQENSKDEIPSVASSSAQDKQSENPVENQKNSNDKIRLTVSSTTQDKQHEKHMENEVNSKNKIPSVMSGTIQSKQHEKNMENEENLKDKYLSKTSSVIRSKRSASEKHIGKGENSKEKSAPEASSITEVEYNENQMGNQEKSKNKIIPVVSNTIQDEQHERSMGKNENSKDKTSSIIPSTTQEKQNENSVKNQKNPEDKISLTSSITTQDKQHEKHIGNQENSKNKIPSVASGTVQSKQHEKNVENEENLKDKPSSKVSRFIMFRRSVSEKRIDKQENSKDKLPSVVSNITQDKHNEKHMEKQKNSKNKIIPVVSNKIQGDQHEKHMGKQEDSKEKPSSIISSTTQDKQHENRVENPKNLKGNISLMTPIATQDKQYEKHMEDKEKSKIKISIVASNTTQGKQHEKGSLKEIKETSEKMNSYKNGEILNENKLVNHTASTQKINDSDSKLTKSDKKESEKKKESSGVSTFIKNSVSTNPRKLRETPISAVDRAAL